MKPLKTNLNLLYYYSKNGIVIALEKLPNLF